MKSSQLSVMQALWILIPAASLNALGMDIMAPAIPQMIGLLQTTEQKIQYIAFAFTLASGVGQPWMGLICDRMGRKKIMLFSTMIFCISSFCSALSDNITTLAWLRFIQGIGACGSLAVTLAVVNDLFDAKDAFRLFSLIGCAMAVTPMLAPLLGVGLMTFFGSWQACFYFLGIFALGTTGICLFALPETKPQDTIVPTLGNLFHHYKEILRHRQFMTFTLFGTLALAELYLYFTIGNILFINKMNQTPFVFSLLFGFNALIFLSGNYLSTILQKKLSSRSICLRGCSLIIVGSSMMAAAYIIFDLTVLGIVIPNTIMTLGVGLMIGPATGAALEPFKDRAGAASGLFGTIQFGFPALLGLFLTQWPIENSLSIALPLLAFSVVSFLVSYFTLKPKLIEINSLA